MNKIVATCGVAMQRERGGGSNSRRKKKLCVCVENVSVTRVVMKEGGMVDVGVCGCLLGGCGCYSGEVRGVQGWDVCVRGDVMQESGGGQCDVISGRVDDVTTFYVDGWEGKIECEGVVFALFFFLFYYCFVYCFCCGVFFLFVLFYLASILLAC